MGPTNNDDQTRIGFRVPTQFWSRFRKVAKARMLTATGLMRVLMLREIEAFEAEQANHDRHAA